MALENKDLGQNQESGAPKKAIRNYLQQAVDKKLIDKSCLEKFDKGTMTSGDFEGLKITIYQR